MILRSKLLIALMSALFVVVGCHRSDTVSEPEGAEIKFSTYIGKSGSTTKGAPLTSFAIGDMFKVFAFDGTGTAYLNNVTVTQLEANKWFYSPLKMWTAGALTFSAYSPVGNVNVTATITNTAQSFNLVVPEDVNKHIDFVIAGANENNNEVNLAFKHITSRISFKAQKDVTDPAKQKVRINSITIDDIATPGDGLIADGVFNVTDVLTSAGTWTLGTTNEVYSPELTHSTSIDLDQTAQSITKDNQSMFVIPQTLTGKTLVVDYEYSLDGGFAWTKYVANIDLGAKIAAGFEIGKHYILTLKLKPSNSYLFVPTIVAWENIDL